LTHKLKVFAMTIEYFICQASVAIAKFRRHNDSTCFLGIVDGDVVAKRQAYFVVRPPDCLILTQSQQQNGLTEAQWTRVGYSLFKEFERTNLL